MKKKDLELEVVELRAFVVEIYGLAKLAKRYHKTGPGYIEEILERLQTKLPKADADE